ncbi:MAG: hypothetical protein ABJA79_04565 [Parafilimonas sp.]
MKKLIYFAIIALLSASCNKNNDNVTPTPVLRELPNTLASAMEIDTIAATAILPLYRGKDANDGDVYFIITESNDVDVSIRMGLNWTPKLIHALGTVAVQNATVVNDGGPKNPHDFPVLKFSGNVDFAPTRNLVPGPDLYPLDPASEPGSVGDATYSPIVTYDGKILFNASHMANSTGVHDKVISMDKVNMTVKLQLVHGFYEGFKILYTTNETSDNDLAALEGNTFAPNMNAAPNPADDKSFRSAREALIPVINGQMGVGNPNRQGLRSAVAGEGDPLNIFQEEAGCDNADDPAFFCDAATYSPLWDVHPVMWTDESIASGAQVVVTTDKREVIAPINIIELYADGFLVSGAPTGPRNSSLGGLNAAGIIVNCPIVFVNEIAR